MVKARSASCILVEFPIQQHSCHNHAIRSSKPSRFLSARGREAQNDILLFLFFRDRGYFDAFQILHCSRILFSQKKKKTHRHGKSRFEESKKQNCVKGREF